MPTELAFRIYYLKDKSSWGSTGKYAEYPGELSGRKLKLPYLSGGILRRPQNHEAHVKDLQSSNKLINTEYYVPAIH